MGHAWARSRWWLLAVPGLAAGQATFGSSGTGNGNLNGAAGLAVDPSTTKVVSGVVKFQTSVARATISRGRIVFATGTSVSLTRGRTQLVLTYRRALRPGEYTLTIRTRHGSGWRTLRQTITIHRNGGAR